MRFVRTPEMIILAVEIEKNDDICVIGLFSVMISVGARIPRLNASIVIDLLSKSITANNG